MELNQVLPRSFGEALKAAKQILTKGSEEGVGAVVDTEAEQLVIASYRMMTGIQLPRVEFFSKIEDSFPKTSAELLFSLSTLRAEGKPLQHLTGFQVFLDHEYEVGSDVLIPRPETEVVLTSAIATLSEGRCSPRLGIEVGIGSGVLSIELLSKFPDLTMAASELTEGARIRALNNAERILGSGLKGCTRLQVIRAGHALDVLSPFETIISHPMADFLISNPPYLVSTDEVEAQVLSFEPHEALFAPVSDPLYFYRSIAEQAHLFIKRDGFVFLEMPHERASEIIKLFSKPKWDAKILPDLNGRDRVLVAKLEEQD